MTQAVDILTRELLGCVVKKAHKLNKFMYQSNIDKWKKIRNDSTQRDVVIDVCKLS